jgi:hypothetical protein
VSWLRGWIDEGIACEVPITFTTWPPARARVCTHSLTTRALEHAHEREHESGTRTRTQKCMHTSSDENIRVSCENASLLRNNRWHVHFKEPPCRYRTVVKQAPEQRVESGRCSTQVACDNAERKWRATMPSAIGVYKWKCALAMVVACVGKVMCFNNAQWWKMCEPKTASG